MILSPCHQLAKALKKFVSGMSHRVIYTARLNNVVYVLHAFQKKTEATSKQDIELAKMRFTDLMRSL